MHLALIAESEGDNYFITGFHRNADLLNEINNV